MITWRARTHKPFESTSSAAYLTKHAKSGTRRSPGYSPRCDRYAGGSPPLGRAVVGCAPATHLASYRLDHAALTYTRPLKIRDVMRQASENPESNQLGGGIDEKALIDAVSASGHPLQAAVLDCLSNTLGEHGRFSAQEEWAYIDSDSGQTRAIDALVELSMWENDSRGMNPRVRPILNLLIECKQSELPFVFFLREEGTLPAYPRVTGLPHESITVTTDDDPSIYSFGVLGVLNLGFHPFVTWPCPAAISLSKVVRKGRSLEVTGEDSYRAITLPLLKATEHLVESCRPRPPRYFFDARLVVTIAVIRGPMVGVIREGGSDELELVPWVRVHHLQPPTDGRERGAIASTRAFDVVHESYLEKYLANLMELADEFAKRAQDRTTVLLEGKGFASGLGHDFIPPEVVPASGNSRRIKLRLLAESLWMHWTRRVPPYGIYVRPPLSKRKPDEDRSP
jgi:hypothetical protein